MNIYIYVFLHSICSVDILNEMISWINSNIFVLIENYKIDLLDVSIVFFYVVIASE